MLLKIDPKIDQSGNDRGQKQVGERVVAISLDGQARQGREVEDVSGLAEVDRRVKREALECLRRTCLCDEWVERQHLETWHVRQRRQEGEQG